MWTKDEVSEVRESLNDAGLQDWGRLYPNQIDPHWWDDEETPEYRLEMETRNETLVPELMRMLADEELAVRPTTSAPRAAWSNQVWMLTRE